MPFGWFERNQDKDYQVAYEKTANYMRILVSWTKSNLLSHLPGKPLKGVELKIESIVKIYKVAKLPTEFYYKVYYVVEFHRF